MLVFKISYNNLLIFLNFLWFYFLTLSEEVTFLPLVIELE